jgi:hypothetical protein
MPLPCKSNSDIDHLFEHIYLFDFDFVPNIRLSNYGPGWNNNNLLLMYLF